MGREQFKTAEEDVAAEFDRVCQLFQLALGKPSDRILFDSLMGEANEQGMNWIQGLEYVIEKRSSELKDEARSLPSRIGVASAKITPAESNDLRKAG